MKSAFLTGQLLFLFFGALFFFLEWTWIVIGLLIWECFVLAGYFTGSKVDWIGNLMYKIGINEKTEVVWAVVIIAIIFPGIAIFLLTILSLCFIVYLGIQSISSSSSSSSSSSPLPTSSSQKIK